MSHFQQSVRHYENAGDRFNAGIGRRNMALALAADGRASEALSYARAALQDYETAGPGPGRRPKAPGSWPPGWRGDGAAG